MSTRLTKALRKEIAEKIYGASDLPTRLEALEATAKKQAVDIVRSAWPAGFAEALKNYPREWFGAVAYVRVHRFTQRRGTEEHIDLSPETIGTVYSSDIRFDDPIPFPVQSVGGEYVVTVHEWLYDTYRPMYQAWAADKQKLTDSTWALLNSYRTVDALLKAAPEMKQFIPTDSTSYPVPALPISNVIATFLERGIILQPA